MNLHEHVMSVYRRCNSGTIPWAAYGGFLLPCGENERGLRNSGCAWLSWEQVCSWMPPAMGHLSGWMGECEIANVDMSIKFVWEDGRRFLRRLYETPVGTIYEDLHKEPSYGSLWVKKYLVESPSDYEVVQYLVENAVFRPNYDAWASADAAMGNDGVVLAPTDRSPFQTALLEVCGTERLYFDLLDNPKPLEDLLEVMADRQNEAYDIMVESPAEIIWIIDNVTADTTVPEMFAKYCVPFYSRQAKKIHQAGKLLAIHLDGKLAALKDLIGATEVDIVESFSLPEMGGDLTIEQAFAAWPDKAITANIPAFLCLEDEETVRQYLRDLLESLGTEKNFMLQLSENFTQDGLLATLPIVADVMASQ